MFSAAVYLAKRRATRNFVLALGVATLTSLVVNDSAMYVVTGAVSVLGPIVRFTRAAAVPFTPRFVVRARVPTPVAVPSEAE